MTRISIHSVELTPMECEVLSEILAAKLDQHLADRAKYMRKTDGAENARDMVDAGQTTGPTNPALTQIPADAARSGSATLPPNRSPNAGSGYEKQRDSRESPALSSSGCVAIRGDADIQDAGNPGPAKPALSPQPPARVAWDLTLRCPDCGSNVEGTRSKYECFNHRCPIGAACGEAFVASRRGGR